MLKKIAVITAFINIKETVWVFYNFIYFNLNILVFLNNLSINFVQI